MKTLKTNVIVCEVLKQTKRGLVNSIEVYSERYKKDSNFHDKKEKVKLFNLL